MYRRIICSNSYIFSGIIPFFKQKEPYDNIEPYVPPPIPTNGYERVKNLFYLNEEGYVNEGYYACIALAMSAATFGFIAGAAFAGPKSSQKFVSENQTTKFVSVYEAQRRMIDRAMIDMINCGVKYFLKCGAFIFTFTFSSLLIRTYRGKDGYLEHIIAGTLACATFRLHMGLKATLVAGLIGCTMGISYAFLIFVIKLLSGSSLQDMEKDIYEFKVNRDSKVRRARQGSLSECNVLTRVMNYDNFKQKYNFDFYNDKDLPYSKIYDDVHQVEESTLPIGKLEHVNEKENA